MIEFLEHFMPWALVLIYVFMAIVYLSAGRIGPTIYWVGAGLLTIGVIVMSRTSV